MNEKVSICVHYKQKDQTSLSANPSLLHLTSTAETKCCSESSATAEVTAGREDDGMGGDVSGSCSTSTERRAASEVTAPQPPAAQRIDLLPGRINTIQNTQLVRSQTKMMMFVIHYGILEMHCVCVSKFSMKNLILDENKTKLRFPEAVR